jgi:6-phosphogluconolactonase
MHPHHNDQTAVRNHMNVINPMSPRVEIRPTASDAANACAAWLAAQIRTLSAAKPLVSLAFSGGKTPTAMLASLARHDVPWSQVHVFQVDERCVPDADERRNAHQLLATLQSVLAAHGVADRLHLLPVPNLLVDSSADSTGSPKQAITTALALQAAKAVFHATTGANLDIVHLGLGDDGHTASLVPGDSVLQATDEDLAVTGAEYQGTRRLTLTYPAIQRAGLVCWLATGHTKAPMVTRLLAGDPTIPAGPLGSHSGVLFLDAAASSGLPA